MEETTINYLPRLSLLNLSLIWVVVWPKLVGWPTGIVSPWYRIYQLVSFGSFTLGEQLGDLQPISNNSADMVISFKIEN